jgi:hypothetical protein
MLISISIILNEGAVDVEGVICGTDWSVGTGTERADD